MENAHNLTSKNKQKERKRIKNTKQLLELKIDPKMNEIL